MEFFVGTFWAFVPAIIAIVLALITKQVYLSLFVGIFAGAMFLAGGNPVEATANMFGTMGSQLGGNGGILVFLVVLGIFSVLLIKTGGSKAYGEWASSSIKTKKGALLSTIGLGSLIFVDDYFNCLTVGSVMRPVTDKHKISRAKLAYLIDSTAAPVCIIAPISSWAAAVAGFIPGDGLVIFIKTIPLNMYAILTIIMMIVFVILKLDLFKMKRNEKAAEKGDLTAGENDLPTEDVKTVNDVKGKMWYLVVPIIILIVCCIGAMIYSGYFYDWDSGVYGTTLQSDDVISAFSNCDAGSALAMGSVIALIITFIILIAGKAISFKDSMASIPEGFKSMVPAILILCFAWTLCATMGAKGAGLESECLDCGEVSAYEDIREDGCGALHLSKVGEFSYLREKECEGTEFGESYQNADGAWVHVCADCNQERPVDETTCTAMVPDLCGSTEFGDAFVNSNGELVHVCTACHMEYPVEVEECPSELYVCGSTNFAEPTVAYDGTLNAKAFILKNVSAEKLGFGVIPAIFFLLACLISFATGTSWGTFGVLIPIAISVTGSAGDGLLYLSMAAVMAGAVYGDHVSPISDTTIMASSGAQCNHLDHVKTQLPYATIVAVVSFIAYLIAGLASQSGASYSLTAGITLPIGLVILAAVITGFYFMDKKGIVDKMDNAITGFFGKLSKHPSERPIEETIQGSTEVSDEIETMQNQDEK